MPYSQELNDSSAIIGKQIDAVDYASMIINQFDEMRQTADHQPLVITVTLHRLSGGLPFRLRALRRTLEHTVKARAEWWITRPGTIARHFRSLQP